MKTTILIVIIALVIIGVFLFKNKSRDYDKAPSDFVLLESEIESYDKLTIVDKNWLKETELKYIGKNWESYPNEYTDQSEKLCNDVYRPWKGEITHFDFISKMTKEQKMYFALINFEAQTNNGGVYQFLFNMPELSLITLESMKYAKMDKLATDYEKVLNQFFGKFKTLEDLNNKFQDNSQKWDKRWNSFAEGYTELNSTAAIEEYFYDKSYTKEFQNKMVQFVKENSNGLMKTE